MTQDTPARRPSVGRPHSGAGGALLSGTGRLAWPVRLYLLTAVLPIWFNLGPLALSTMRVLLIALLIPLLARLFSGKMGRILPTDILFILYSVWTVISLAINNPTHVIEFAGSTNVEFLGGYLLARAYIRDRGDFAALCRWLTFLTVATVPLAIIESLTREPVLLEFIRNLPGMDTFKRVYADPRWGLFRAQTVFAHPIHYGLFCSVVFPLSYIALKGTVSGVWRIGASGAILLGTFLSLSSGAFLSMILQLGIILWAAVFARVKARWKILLALFVFLYVLVDLLSNRTPMRVFMSYATFSAYTAFWRGLIFEYGMQNVWANPILGLGLNDWERPAFMVTGSVDNFWLLTAMRYGIPGFLTLVIGYFLPLWQIGRRDFDADQVLWRQRRAWSFTFASLSFTLATVAIWSSLYSFVFFMFGAGVWLLTAQPEDGNEKQADDAARPAGPSHARSDIPGRYTRFPPGTVAAPAPVTRQDLGSIPAR